MPSTKGIFFHQTSSLHITFPLISIVSFQSSLFFPTVYPTLRGQLPDDSSPMPSIKGILLHQFSSLHIIFHLILQFNSLSPSRSSSSNMFDPPKPSSITLSSPSILTTCQYHLNRDFFITSVIFTEPDTVRFIARSLALVNAAPLN